MKIEIKAEVAGSVFQIEAKVGAEMRKGDVIMLLESMKMEVPVVAPAAGRLTEILVAEEDAIVRGQVVASIES
jgi:acetyl-CoA carboxylase biotin carboxyl carrier protein